MPGDAIAQCQHFLIFFGAIGNHEGALFGRETVAGYRQNCEIYDELFSQLRCWIRSLVGT